MIYNHHMCLVDEPEKGQMFWDYRTNRLCVMVNDSKFRIFGDITNNEYEFESEMMFNIDYGYFDDEPFMWRQGQVVYKDGERFYVESCELGEYDIAKIHLESMDSSTDIVIGETDMSEYSQYPTNKHYLKFKHKFNIPEYTCKQTDLNYKSIFTLSFDKPMFMLCCAYTIQSSSMCFDALVVNIDTDYIEFVRVQNGKTIPFIMRPKEVNQYKILIKPMKSYLVGYK